MRIFVAGTHSLQALGGRALAGASVLLSYADIYVKKRPTVMSQKFLDFILELRKYGAIVFLDSGAFSMDTRGVSIDMSSYCKFLERYGSLFHCVIVLDVIGRRSNAAYTAELSYRNWLYMKDVHPVVMPVIHEHEPFQFWAEKYIEKGAKIIGVGIPKQGIERESKLSHPLLWEYRFHALGNVSPRVLGKAPFYSADAKTPLLGWAFGNQIVTDFLGTTDIPFRWGNVVKPRRYARLRTTEMARFYAVVEPRYLQVMAIQLVRRAEEFYTQLWASRGVIWRDPWEAGEPRVSLSATS